MPDPIISVSGLRGIIGESLTPDVVVRYVAAFLVDLPRGLIVVSRDGRATGPMIAQAVRAAIAASGRDVLDAGVAPTPTVGVLVREHGAAGGIQITASHNPPEYNGLKLFSSEGRVLPALPGQRVLEDYRAGRSAWVSHERIGQVAVIADPLQAHLALILKTIDHGRIAAQRYRVLVDANHGSGGPLAARLLAGLGCTVHVIGEEATGQFAHPPEPTAENLQTVLAKVRETKSQVGFCLDPDADRLAVIDETGRYLGEECTLAMCAHHVLRQRPGSVVVNCSTSRMTDDLAARYGVDCHHSKVGEANVVDEMLRHAAVLGGEGNGGVIDPRVGLVRDSFVGMALLLDAMADRGLPVSQLADELPQYAIHKTKASLPPERIASSFAKLKQHFSDARADDLDGLRLDWPGKWLLIRASNTEPIVRIIAEAKDEVEARRLCEEAIEVVATI